MGTNRREIRSFKSFGHCSAQSTRSPFSSAHLDRNGSDWARYIVRGLPSITPRCDDPLITGMPSFDACCCSMTSPVEMTTEVY